MSSMESLLHPRQRDHAVVRFSMRISAGCEPTKPCPKSKQITDLYQLQPWHGMDHRTPKCHLFVPQQIDTNG